MKTSASRLLIQPTVVWAELPDQAILLNVETGMYYGLDAIGNQIWRLLLQGLDVEQIYDQLLGCYEVSPDQLRADMMAFVDVLASRGLVTVSGALIR